MMPTGYTAKLHDGEPQTFDEFVLGCARASGALIVMRDSAPDAPIPDEFEPDTAWHDEAIEKATASLETLRAMPLAEAREWAQAEFDEIGQERERAAHKRVEIEERYYSMLAKVTEWDPPTDEHQGLKDFMIEQLNESIRFDCSPMGQWPEYPKLTPRKWLDQKIAKAERDLTYHTEQRKQEIERTESRNAWVRNLRRSLSGGAVSDVESV